MNKFIPLSVPNIKGNEKKYIIDAIEQEWVSTAGSYITRFEEQIAKYLRVSHAVACQSGTAGLHLALLASGVQAGMEVIVPTLTFIAAVNPVSYVGAYPVFMDCDEGLTLDAEKLERFCQEECEFNDDKLINKTSKRQVKAIVAVHVFGNAANMEKIMTVAQKYGLKVIEDATEALGTYYTEGKYKGQFLGTIGDVGVYSFNGNKIITTGGGGMVVAKNEELLKKVKYLSTQAKDDTLYYIHHEIGYNYRMTNIQAALGVGQLEQLENFIKIKKRNYQIYQAALEKKKTYRLLNFRENIRPNYWFYAVVLDDKAHSDRDRLIKELAEDKIQTRPIWGLIHEQQPYRDCQAYKIERASYYHDRVVNIPCSSNLTEEEVQRVLKALEIRIGE